MTDIDTSPQPDSSRAAPHGAFRLTGYDKYDYSDYHIADFGSLAEARDEAITRAAKPNGSPLEFSDDFFVYDGHGNCLLKVESSESGPVESRMSPGGDEGTSVPENRPKDSPVLHWSISVILLSVSCAAAAWVSAMGTTWGKSHGDAGAMAFALILLLGLDPFFMRRNHYFTPGGLIIVAGVGVAIAASSWLFHFNMIVFVWIGMTWALISVAKPTERGKMIAYQIDLEKATRKSWLNTKTEQSERMLFVYDFLTALLVGFLLLAAWSAVAADAQRAEFCAVHALTDKCDFDTATACVMTGAGPSLKMRNSQTLHNIEATRRWP